MMNLHFYKYQGTGNDFILFDNRDGNISLTNEQVAFLCHRRFGIGADGLMLLEKVEGYDFKMVYYNADGNESTMCGNGGRCITSFAKMLGVIADTTNFLAIDGGHTAIINNDNTISLHMQDVNEIKKGPFYTALNTGSPHYVKEVADIREAEVVNIGREIRNRDEYQPKGINVNFVQRTADGIWVRTYERGVEDETLSCGTGVTASAIAASDDNTGTFETKIYTPGGELKVSFEKDTATSAKHVVLTGPAQYVYEGDVKL
jgi:diaminopimelate epimerase